jgi:hypothetical protein
MARSFGPAALALATAALLPGCGDGERLYRVSGTITFDGKPIPKGLIFFDPAPGTPGTQGFANIEDGRFDTAAAGKGRGIRSGNYVIRISGFDGIERPEAPFGQALFPEHELTKELPSQDQTFDYDVKPKR